VKALLNTKNTWGLDFYLYMFSKFEAFRHKDSR
jgi:hypothetical protein